MVLFFACDGKCHPIWYDAVLLAEATPLSLDLLRRVCEGKKVPWPHALDPGFVRTWRPVDWKNFALEYPALAVSDPKDWIERLAGVLRLMP